jgi:DNA-binding HxlR family transcriptional regulator
MTASSRVDASNHHDTPGRAIMWKVLASIPPTGCVMTTEVRAKEDGCPVAKTAEIIGNKWTPLIVRDLAHGQKRFSELERSLRGISPKTLSERLKRLEEAAVVDRHCFAEVPPRVEYTLTAKGHALLPVIDSMRAFGREWLADEECEPEGAVVSAHSGEL